MANYTINTAGSTTCNYPSTVNANDVLTFNITRTTTSTKYQGSMLTYTFPCDCTAEILAAGARGGRGANVATTATGRGAIVAGTFEFKTGDQLLICVGQAGTDHPYATSMTSSDGTVGAGGGGTYVVKKVSSSSYRYTGSGTGNNWYVEPLVIGAGGNGSGDNGYSGNTQVHGSSSQGNENTFSFSSSNNGGCFSKQPSSGVGDYNGYCFLKGAQGASSSYNRGGTSYAGFGGGSSNWDDGYYGSPGGGFTGGGAYDGEVTAATSYVATNATNISRKSGAYQGNNGEGYVKITFKTVVPLHEIPDGFVEKIKEFNTQVKVNNAWKSSDKSFVKVNNAWKEINKMYTKVNNSWIETGKNAFYHNNWVIHEGYISDSMFYEGWIGNATYSSYTPGEGITLYTDQGSWNNQYPVAIGAISSLYWVVAYNDTWKISFQRTTGNTEFEIGVALVTDTSILTTGRLNTTNFNSITKKYGQRFNVNNGVFTFCPAELFGEEYEEELYDFNTYIAFYLYSPTNALTIVDITSALECFPIHCVMHEGALEDTSMTGNYTGHSTYSPYSSAGISLYKEYGTTYPVSIGCFNAPMDAREIYAIDIAYEVDGTTVPNASLGFAYLSSQYNGRTNSSGPTTVQTHFTTFSPIDKLQGSVSLHLDSTADYSTLENVYFAIFLNSTQSNSVVVKVKGIYFYMSDDLELGGGSGGSSGGGTTNNNSIYLVQNGIVNNNTIFGALQETIGITDSSSTNSGIGVSCSNSTAVYQCRRFSFGNKVDSSLIEKMIIKWKFTDASIQGRTGELVVGWTSSIQTTYGNYNNYTNTATNVMNLTTANTEYTVEFPTDWSGENYLSFATRSRTANNTIDYYITEIQVVMKDNSGSGGSAGGGTTTKDPVYLIQNGKANNNTIYGSMMTDNNYVNSSLAMLVSPYYTGVSMGNANVGYAYTAFNQKVDLSDIKEIQVKFYPYANYDNTNSDEFGLIAMNSSALANGSTSLPSGTTILGKTTLNFNSNNEKTITVSVTNSNLSGTKYLGLMYYNSSSGSSGSSVYCIIIKEVKVIYKDGTSSGGSTGGLTLRQGYYNSDGEFIFDASGESVVTDKISVKSISDSTNCVFTVTSTSFKECILYLEVWGSDGTLGTYIHYIEIGNTSFASNVTEYIDFTKAMLANWLNLSSGYDIGHVAFSIYSDNSTAINLSEFTVTFYTTNSGGSGTMPIEDI